MMKRERFSDGKEAHREINHKVKLCILELI